MKKLLIIFFTVTSFNSCVIMPISLGPRLEPFNEKVLHKGSDEKVLVIDINGAIFDNRPTNVFGSSTKINLTARIREELDMARKDKKIKALILKIDSPGGAVTASDILHHEILRYKTENNIFVLTQMGAVAASGGYYIAVASDHIQAYPTTITASIGVIATMFNVKGLMDKIGIEDQTVTSGKSKSMGSPFKKMNDNERKLFKSIIDSMYTRFFNIVLEGRPKLTKKKLSAVADGRILIADDALKAGLIDSIGYWTDAVETVKERVSIEDPTIICYTRPGDYKPNVYGQVSVKNEGTINMINLDTDLFLNKFGIRLMYLWMP